MKKTSNYFKNVFLTMTFATFSILIIALIVLHLQFAKSAKGYISDTNLRFMKNAAETISHKVQYAQNNMLSLYTSSAGITLLTSNDISQNEELNALRTIDVFFSYDSNIFSAYIYNQSKEIIYTMGSDLTASSRNDFFDMEVFDILENENSNISTPYLRTIPYSKYETTPINVCSFIFAEYSEQTPTKAGVINIKTEDLFSILSSKQTKEYLQSNFLVFTKEENLMYTHFFEENLLNTSIQELENIAQHENGATIKINNHSFFVNQYIDPTTGWIYYSLNSNAAIYDSFQLFTISFVFIISSALVLGLILNFSLSKYLYLPIKKLSHKVSTIGNHSAPNKNEMEFLAEKFSDATIAINSLFKFKESTINLSQASFLKSTIEQGMLSNDAFFKACKEREINFNSNDTFYIVNIAWLNQDKDLDDAMIEYALINIIYELLLPYYNVKHFFDSTHNITLVCSNKCDNSKNLHTLLQTLHLTFTTHFHLELICFFSNETKCVCDLYNSFTLFKVATPRYLFLENNGIFNEQEISLNSLKKGSCDQPPFHILENKIRSSDEYMSIQYISDFFNELKQYSLASIFSSIGFFSVEFVHMIERIEKSIIQPLNTNYDELYMSLIHASTINNAKEIVIDTMHKLCAADEASRDSALMQIVSKLIEFIHQEYADFALSSKSMADDNHISVSKLNRGFKIKTGLSASNYIKEYRMKQSKMLLLKTNLPVETIACRVGFENTKYYYSLFKKEYGVSPSMFRMMNGKQKIE